MEVPRSLAGTRFGPYEVRSLLGRGGMGEVYEAFDTGKDRVVALKVLPEQLAQDPTYRERFRRESHIAAGLAEPHIVPIHDSGEIDGTLYIDMRLVRGENLRTLLRRQGPLAPDRAIAIVEQVAAALDAAHSAGLVHRDVKPANILVTPADFAYLADFGVARSEGDTAATTTGTHAAASYTYMAPERFDAGPVTTRADIYSLACVLYECLTGSTPFPAQSVSVLIRSHLSEPPPRPSAERPDVPEAVDAVIARALAKSAADRYQTAGQFAAATRSALAAGARSAAAGTPPDSVTTGVFGAELLAEAPPTPPTPEPAIDDAPTPVDLPVATVQDYRREPEPTTFQPFGPDGPTIAANFQPRGPLITPPEGAPAAPVSGGPADSAAAPSVPASDAGASADSTTSRGYETTGTLRIIAPPDADEREATGDLPVIHPADPTLVHPGEFHYSPLQADGSAAAVKPPVSRPQPAVPAAARSAEPSSAYADPIPGSEHRTQLLDPAQFHTDPRSAPRPRSGEDTGSPAEGETTAGSDSDTRFLDISQFGTGAGDTQFLEVAGLRGQTRYDDDHYDESGAEDAGAEDAGYEDAGYEDSAFDESGYDESGYEDDPRYAHDAGYHDETDPEDSYADDSYADDEFAFAAADYDEAPPAKRSRSVAVPVVLGVLGAVVVAGLGVVGWQVFGSSSSDDAPATASGPATSAAAPQRAATGVAPTTAAPTTTTGATPALPVGASPCSQSATAGESFGKAATGSEVTSCGFAEAVRQAYAKAARSHGATSAATADANTSIIAVSPVTGRSYPMTCTSSGKVVTCTGGDNAVVYVY
ncbi:serine/threonine-protein kinase [Nocardia spumae]|uniref:serine/threonine-protein kinase n=1 Tax=Nocardia spumae TaxID=2887190 RepID=UPI001D145CF7|nr:serine/threonine-protein kinase [Nocardia spumae]